jgi:hypothetical protein
MDEGTQAIISKLEEKIRALKQARDTLIEQFGESSQTGNHRRKKRESGRREEVVTFLRKTGAAKSSEIVEKTGIPIGTLGGILKDRTSFSRDDQGKWSLVKDNA